MKPVLFVTGHVPAYRVGGLAALHEREQIEVARFGGRSLHGGADVVGDLPFPNRRATPAQLARLAASGAYRAVVCPTGGRLALLATWGGARAGRTALILWASLWAHPRSAAHALSYVPLRRLYRSADAVVTYGPHVSAYVTARGARNVHVAPQAVDNEFWSADQTSPPAGPAWPPGAGTKFLFVGRPAPEKGLGTLLAAWRAARLPAQVAALVLAGVGRDFPSSAPTGASAPERMAEVVTLDPLAPADLRDLYAAADVLILPSLETATFREPWGLVVNEAMNRGLAVIASDAVGAVAGGLVRDGETGLVVPAGQPGALAAAIERLAGDAPLRAQMGAAGRQAVAGYSYDAWADGFSLALSTVGLSRGRW